MPVSILNFTPLFVLFGQIAFLAFIFLLPLKLPRAVGLLTIPVSTDFLASAEAQRIIRRYRLADILLALGAVAIAIAAWTLHSDTGLILAPITQIIGLSILWTTTWRAILPHRLEQPIVRTASLTEMPGPSPAWFVETLAALLPVALTAFYLAAHWSQIPQSFATRYTSSGQPAEWVTRTPLQVAWPLLLAGGLILWLAFLGWLLTRYTPSSTGKPRVLAFTLDILRSVAWLLAILMSAAALLPVLVLSAATLPIFLGSMMLLLLAFLTYISVRAWHTFRGLPSDQSTSAQYWVAGVFYFNRDDAALLVPKRSGMGYTFNMARPAAWILMVAILLLALIPLAWTFGAHHG
jgi:uncharacterized membrane protein